MQGVLRNHQQLHISTDRDPHDFSNNLNYTNDERLLCYDILNFLLDFHIYNFIADEININYLVSFTGCHAGQFLCANGNCIQNTRKCDSKDDCGDRSEELHCRKCYIILIIIMLSVEWRYTLH